MSLLHLKSIFGPNTDITPWQADVHLNEKITNHVHHKGGGGEVFHPEGHTLLDDDVRPFIKI